MQPFYARCRHWSHKVNKGIVFIFVCFVLLPGSISVGEVKSPMRLLFGAAKSPGRPSTSSDSIGVRSSRRNLLPSTESDVFEVCSVTIAVFPTEFLG